MFASARCTSRFSLFVSIVGIAAVALFGIAGCGTSAPNGSTPLQGTGATNSAASSTAPAGNISGGAKLGLLWSPADKTLRPIIGVPGSSWLGASLVPADAYDSAAYSPASGATLLTDSRGNLTILSSASQQPVVLAQGAPAGATILFSPDGQRAAVFTPGSGFAMLVSGLPDQPAVSSMNFTSAIAAMAVSNDGTLLIASPGSAGLSITQISAGGASSTVATVAGFGGMAFLPGSDDFLLADSANNALLLVHNGIAKTLATKADGLSQPLAVAASADGQWAITANSADGTLVRVSLSGTASPVRALCACSPAQLLPLAGNAVFELTQPGTSPSWLMDAGRNTPSIFFIPPAPGKTGSSQ